MVIAIDGPAGSGKGTVSSILAKKLNFIYVDTGIMYRCLGLKCIMNDISIDDEKKILETLKNMKIECSNNEVILDGKKVTKEIRTEEVSMKSSLISNIVNVRKMMTDKIRNISKDKNVVMEGRDITTVVFPNAKYKFYLDAKEEIRAERRAKQINKNYEEVLIDMKKRDYNDMHKEVGSLKRTKDQYYIDSSNMTIEEVVNKMLEVINNE